MAEERHGLPVLILRFPDRRESWRLPRAFQKATLTFCNFEYALLLSGQGEWDLLIIQRHFGNSS